MDGNCKNNPKDISKIKVFRENKKTVVDIRQKKYTVFLTGSLTEEASKAFELKKQTKEKNTQTREHTYQGHISE